MSDYGVFEASSTDGHEEEQRQRQATRDLGTAIEAAREGFGEFLAGATNKDDYQDRLALVMNDLMQKVADAGVMPVPGVMRKVKAALRPEFRKATSSVVDEFAEFLKSAPPENGIENNAWDFMEQNKYPLSVFDAIMDGVNKATASRKQANDIPWFSNRDGSDEVRFSNGSYMLINPDGSWQVGDGTFMTTGQESSVERAKEVATEQLFFFGSKSAKRKVAGDLDDFESWVSEEANSVYDSASASRYLSTFPSGEEPFDNDPDALLYAYENQFAEAALRPEFRKAEKFQPGDKVKDLNWGTFPTDPLTVVSVDGDQVTVDFNGNHETKSADSLEKVSRKQAADEGYDSWRADMDKIEKVFDDADAWGDLAPDWALKSREQMIELGEERGYITSRRKTALKWKDTDFNSWVKMDGGAWSLEVEETGGNFWVYFNGGPADGQMEQLSASSMEEAKAEAESIASSKGITASRKHAAETFQPGDKVTKSGYPGTVQSEYMEGMYEVRLESGTVVVPAEELTRVSSNKMAEDAPMTAQILTKNGWETVPFYRFVQFEFDSGTVVVEVELDGRVQQIELPRKQFKMMNQASRKQAIAPHPDYGEGVWSDEGIKQKVLGLDPSLPIPELVDKMMEAMGDYYDSIDRELAFWYFSQVTGNDYNDYYDAWMNHEDPMKYFSSSRKQAAVTWFELEDGFSTWDPSGTPPRGLSGQIVEMVDGRIQWYVEDPYDANAGTVEYGFADSSEEAKSKIENLLTRLGVASRKTANSSAEGFLLHLKDQGFTMPKDAGRPGEDGEMDDELYSYFGGDQAKISEVSQFLNDNWSTYAYGSRKQATPLQTLILDSLSELLLDGSLSTEDEDAIERAYGQAEKGKWEAAYNSVTFVADGPDLDSRANTLVESILDDIESIVGRTGSRKQALDIDGSWEEELSGIGYASCTPRAGGGFEVYMWSESQQSEAIGHAPTSEAARQVWRDFRDRDGSGSGFDHIDF